MAMRSKTIKDIPHDGPTLSTRDFYLAAALLAKGARFLRVEPDGGIGFFVFSDRATCEKWTEEYFQGDLMVRAKDMTGAIRSLKDALFSAMPGNYRR